VNFEMVHGHRAFITACTIGEVCQPPQLPSAAPYPVTHRAASVTARATLPAAHRRAGVLRAPVAAAGRRSAFFAVAASAAVITAISRIWSMT
jgi:hypothetical protein